VVSEVRSLKDARVESSRRGLVLVFASVGALWLIAVTNIAGLTLVQVRRRARELAIRAALGASRGRAITMVWREGLIIGALGGALGVAIAIGLVRAIRSDRHAAQTGGSTGARSFLITTFRDGHRQRYPCRRWNTA
jgi:ABC-type antimicrobial peptide transport system permease subunit